MLSATSTAFVIKKVPCKTFLILKFVLDMSNWTLCRTIQEVKFITRPCTSRSSDFKIAHTITP